jgi:hypothetical protein
MILLPGEEEFFTHVLLVIGAPVQDIEVGPPTGKDGAFDHAQASALTNNIVDGLAFMKHYDEVRLPVRTARGLAPEAAWGQFERFRSWYRERQRAEALG